MAFHGLKNHEKYMTEALTQAKKALEKGEFPVGAVFVYEDEIIATGQRQNTADSARINELDHGEMVGLRELVCSHHDIVMEDVTLYCTMEPCLMCFSTLLLSGIRNIVYGYEDVMGGGTNLPLKQLNPLYKDIKMVIKKHVMREECLELFYRFFKNPDQRYWKKSLLSEYTIEEGRKLKNHE